METIFGKMEGYMKRVRVGFSLLLMGIILSVSGDTFFWWGGVLFGIIGMIMIISSKEK